MRTLDKKISKIKRLNEDVTTKLRIADMLFYDKELSIDDVIDDINQNVPENFKTFHFYRLYENTENIKKLCDKVKNRHFRVINRNKKAGYNKELEKYLRSLERIFINNHWGVIHHLEEIMENADVENDDFYKAFAEIEKDYNKIYNLVKGSINKWHRFITVRIVILTSVLLILFSLIALLK